MNIKVPEGAVSVHFKDEDEIDGQRVGPVWFRMATGPSVPAVQWETGDGLMTGWLPKSEALRLAHEFKLGFKEL